MIGFSRARVGAVAALATAFSLVVVPVSAAHASSTPAITSVPSAVHALSTLTVTGSGLEDTDAVTIAGTPLSGLVASASQVTGTVPSTALTGTVAVHTTTGGTATAPSVSVIPVISGLTGAVGDHSAVVSWASGGTGTAIVRDLTGLSGPFSPTDGTDVPVSGLTATDTTGFHNTTSRTYGVWATNSDNTVSDAPALRTIDPAPLTSVTLVPSYTSAAWGTTLTLSGTLRHAGLPLGGHTVDLWGATVGQPEVFLRHVPTAGDGSYHTSVMPARSTVYSFRYPGDAFWDGSVSTHVLVRVVARLSAAFSPTTVLRGQASILRGQVLPRIAGVVLLVQRHVGTTWQTSSRVRTASDGTYRLPLAMPVGVHGFRVVLPAMTGLATAISPQAVLRVDPRNLIDGMSGSDVLTLQQLLTRLHYDAGALDGHYGYDLHHAVMTFQKVERLPVTGSWGNADRLRATHPTAWRVRYPGSGRAVEIDITRQVLVLSERGVVRRIIDVSTGSGKVYYQDGARNIARTPRGHFSVYYKINGIRISKLGELYKPSYFFQGYAVHGSASVPNYPASHGCVRITNPNADRIFPLLTVHTPVTLYDE